MTPDVAKCPFAEGWEESHLQLRTTGLTHVDHHGPPRDGDKDITGLGQFPLGPWDGSSRVHSCLIRMPWVVSRVLGQYQVWKWRGRSGKEV